MELAADLIKGGVVIILLIFMIVAPLCEAAEAVLLINCFLAVAWLINLAESDATTIVVVTAVFFGYALYSFVVLWWLDGGAYHLRKRMSEKRRQNRRNY